MKPRSSKAEKLMLESMDDLDRAMQIGTRPLDDRPPCATISELADFLRRVQAGTILVRKL